MGLNAGPAIGETTRLGNMRILNQIHEEMGEVMRGKRYWNSIPRLCFVGRQEYQDLQICGLTLFSGEYLDTNGENRVAQYVMGLEIVQVDRDQFLMVV